MKRLVLLMFALLMVLADVSAKSKTVKVNNLKFMVNTETRQAKLLPANYSGDVVVPEKFVYDKVEYTVTAFSDRCFSSCTTLTSISIPKTVTELGQLCFEGCYGLMKVTCAATNPPLENDAFVSFSNFDKCELYVPETSVYRLAPGWQKFKNIYQQD